jgi:NAD(P)-dependent dehydrogenase (short-subunit alcohol dehydrogenase family)
MVSWLPRSAGCGASEVAGRATDLSAKGSAEGAGRPVADRGGNSLQGAIQQIVGTTALGRLGEANDVGAAIAAVLSDDFRWVTGQHIEASGGARLSVAS